MSTVLFAQISVHSLSDVGHAEILILLLITLLFIALFFIGVCLIVPRLIRIGRSYLRFISGSWTDEPDVHWRKSDDPDFIPGMFTEQQGLLNQLLSQGHEDGDAHDFSDISHDMWS